MKITYIGLKLSREFQSCEAGAEVQEGEDLTAAYKQLQAEIDAQLTKVLQRIEYQKNGVSPPILNMQKFKESLGITDTPEEAEARRQATQKEQTRRHMIEGAMKEKQRKEAVNDFEAVSPHDKTMQEKRAPRTRGKKESPQEPMQLTIGS
jgi:hypothetical protein